MSDHTTRIIVTKLMGTHYQAECSCGWLAPVSRANRRAAENDAKAHKEGAK